MLTITIKANVPAADAQGIKERIAMDIERYGDCKVVSITGTHTDPYHYQMYFHTELLPNVDVKP